MSTVQSSAVISGIMPDYAKIGGVLNRVGSYTVATAALAVDDVIEMVPIPEDAKIIDMKLGIASASKFSTFDVGDASDVNRFFDGIPTGMVDNTFSLFGDGTSNGPNYRYTGQDTIDITVLTSQLAVGTRLDLSVQYIMVGTITDEI